jgi:ABC-type glycerol-3-phosphate transport system substrate-binding protein
MKKMKKLLALCLALAMAFTLTACGGDGDTDTTQAPGTSDADFGQQAAIGQGAARQDGRIDMGGWWRPYYFSDDDSVEVDPSYSGSDESHMKFERMQFVQDKYGLPIYFNNLTFEGNMESLNTSIIAGSPDMDIYMVDMNRAVPIQFSGLGLDLRTILPADHDIFTTQSRLTFIDFQDGKAVFFKPVTEEAAVDNVCVLAFNLQILEANNLERPDALWERGEWTWAKFEEYMKTLTQDTNGDGEIDQYGFAGWVGDFMPRLLLSNGTYIANSATENISSAEVGEVLQFISDMYTVWKVANPYDRSAGAQNWDIQRFAYREGNIAFWPIFNWIASQNDDYGYRGEGTPLGFDTVWVRWPVGPSGNQETNAGDILTAGNVYMLPANVAEPELVFNYMDDYWNWYEGDLDLRASTADLNWYYGVSSNKEEIQDHNFSVAYDAGSKRSIELWESVSPDGFWENVDGLIDGTITPAQMQATLANSYQARLTIMFGN